MVDFIDRNGIKRRLEFSKSFAKGWIKITLDTPDKQNYASCWEMPVWAIEDLENNLKAIKEEINGL